MVSLPASIEIYLQEAGFSPTEILILKKLLEGDAATLRELAAKTGKSTGVLAQATKKLAEKQIVTRQHINNTEKYVIGSLDVIQEWVERDMQKQHDVLDRKKLDFDAFLSTVKHEKGRPEMEFFEGLDGIKKAFAKLLERNETEWLQFVPAIIREEDDPVNDMRVQIFRDRRKRKIFARTIAPNVPLGRRYKSSDVFQYRQSRLVSPEDFPVTFEKIIVGNTVACIDLLEQKASFIHYQELADGQRNLFNLMWRQAKEEGVEEVEEIKDPPLETKVLSGLREFFLSKKSLMTLSLLGVVAGLMTWGLYENNTRLNLERVRDRAMSIAATSALQFRASDLDQLRTRADAKKPVYRDVILRMQRIREQNEGVVYLYIIRPEDDATVFSFIADADSLDLDAKADLNHDGMIDDADWLSPLGDIYEDPEGAHMMSEALKNGPRADIEPVTDQWGTWISGHAPILDDDGKPIAVIGIDINASEVQMLTLRTFRPFVYFLLLFVLFLFIRLAAFYRSLMNQIVLLSKAKNTSLMIRVFVCVTTSLVITMGLNQHNKYLNTQRIREKVRAIAATAAPELNSESISKIHKWQDYSKPEYEELVKQLNKIRKRNPDVIYVYIMRATEDPYFFEFVVDADSLNLKARDDLNEDGLINDMVAPGQLWLDGDPKNSAIHRAKSNPAADRTPAHDEWGTWISGHAPIQDNYGNTVAILGIDMYANEVEKLTKESFSFINNVISFSVILLTISFLTFNKSILKTNIKKFAKPRP